jgi:hypothetical protein
MYKHSRNWVDILIFCVFLFWAMYLLWRDFEMDPAASVHQILCKVRLRPWQWLDKRSGKKACTIHGCLNGMLGSGQTEKGDTSEEKNQVLHFWPAWIKIGSSQYVWVKLPYIIVFRKCFRISRVVLHGRSFLISTVKGFQMSAKNMQ